METGLKKLFDYQRYEQEESLARLIVEVKDKYKIGRVVLELSDEDLELNAAGEAAVRKRPWKKPE